MTCLFGYMYLRIRDRCSDLYVGIVVVEMCLSVQYVGKGERT